MTVQCNLILDSCCELPEEIYDQPGIQMLHFSYTNSGKNYVDDIFQEISAHQFYEAMRNGATPSTSQPAQSEIEEAFRAAIASKIPTVYLAFSSGISGAYDGAIVALERMKAEFGNDIELYVVDTRVGSTPQGVLVMEALRLRDKGMTAKEMVAWAQEARFFLQTLFVVDDLESLRRGGRIPTGIAMAGAKLDVKPMLSFDIDGKLTLIGMARGRKKAMKRMVEFFEKNHDASQSSTIVAIGNADCPKDATRFREMLQHNEENTLFLETSIGPTIGCHGGPDMFSISFWGSDRREKLSVSDRIANRVKAS